MSDREVLELTKLDGTNYSMWKFGVMFVLQAKELTGFVLGTVDEPDKETKLEDWKTWIKRSSQAAVILLSSVEKNLHPNLINCSTPQEIWDKIKVLYGDTTIDAKQNAWEQFYAFKMTDSETVALQIEKLESICKKLEDSGEKPSETAVVSKLLSSLPPKFSVFRIAWDCTPEAERKKVNLIARLIKEDKRLAGNEENVTALAFQVQKTTLGNRPKKGQRKHNIQELKKRTKCALCKEKGHWVRECPKKNEVSEGASAYISDVTATFSSTCEEDSEVWIADSGASMHMTFKQEYFTHLEAPAEEYLVKVADDKILQASGIGTIIIQEKLLGRLQERELRNVLFVPELKRNLFSIGTISDNNFSFHAYKEKCEIRGCDGKLSSVGVRYKNLYRMLFEVKVPVNCNLAQVKGCSQSDKLKLWHERMAHVNIRAVKNTCKQLGVGEPGLKAEKDFFCEACLTGKQSRKHHASIKSEMNYKPGEKIHTDVCGPVNIESPRGSKYFLLFKDECTSFRKVYFLRHKSEVFEKFREFNAFVLTQLNTKIKVLKSDNGTEYTSRDFEKYLCENGIVHERSSPYIHEQNGRAEREIRTLVETARSIILAKSVNSKLWPEAINTVCYILNRVILQPSEKETPYEKWFGRKPQIKHLKVFGVDAYLNIPKEKRTKFGPKSKKVTFVGYDGESNNYRLWDNDTSKIYISSDVDFNEQQAVKHPITQFPIVLDFQISEESTYDEAEAAAPEQVQIPQQDVTNERRVLRDRNLVHVPDRYGIPVAFFAHAVPSNYNQAVISQDAEKWKEAMNEEIEALNENKTWTLSGLPPNKRLIGCRWVFAVKTDPAGNVERYKARLVAKGFSQREGIDYSETYAPVVRYESIRLLLAIVAARDYEIKKFDVKTAFLYGELQEEIYLEQPEGYVDPNNANCVCRLHKSLYGLKQSPRCWNEKFVDFLRAFSFVPCDSDKCVFIGHVKGLKVYLALYVDDGLIVCENMSAIDEVLNVLKGSFKITVDNACEFVGLEIIRNRKQRLLTINQAGYVRRLIDKFAMQDAKFSSIPAEPGAYLRKNPESIQSNTNIPYREAVGSLLFAARVSRPDIEYAVNYASQFLDCYSQEHWQFVKKILRYLKGTVDFGITFGNSGSLDSLHGFTDADYAGCLDTRKSRSGFVFVLNGAPISWSSKRQCVVSLSTAESEYIALAHGVQEAVWLRQFLLELNVDFKEIKIFVDNQAAIKLASNSECHKRSKHIDVRYHFIRDIVNTKQVELEYIPTTDQLADIFTKPLAKKQFTYLRFQLNILDHSK